MINDPVSASRLTLVHPELADKWILLREEFWEINELQLRVTQGLRTYQEQWALFALGRKKDQKGNWFIFDKKKIVTNARGGESYHNFGLALDSACMGDDPYLERMSFDDRTFLWQEYGRLAQKHGLEWGGNWKNLPDRPHVQLTFDLSLSDLQIVYEENGLKAVFSKCNQIMDCGKELA